MTKNLKELYIEEGWDLDKLFEIKTALIRAIQCPCISQHECIHKILPEYRVGGFICTESCQASKIWLNMKGKIKQIINEYLFGIE